MKINKEKHPTDLIAVSVKYRIPPDQFVACTDFAVIVDVFVFELPPFDRQVSDEWLAGGQGSAIDDHCHAPGADDRVPSFHDPSDQPIFFDPNLVSCRTN